METVLLLLVVKDRPLSLWACVDCGGGNRNDEDDNAAEDNEHDDDDDDDAYARRTIAFIMLRCVSQV